MIAEQKRERLRKAHLQENLLNSEMSYADKEIQRLKKLKKKIAKQISSNMKYRNKLINS